jgi:hypothetical protein
MEKEAQLPPLQQPVRIGYPTQAPNMIVPSILRYALFYFDDLVVDNIKIKSLVRQTFTDREFLNQEKLQDPAF